MPFWDKFSFDKLKTGLNKTKNDLLGKINRLIYAKSNIDEDFIIELEEIFLSADIGFETSEQLMINIKERVKQQKYEDPEELQKIIIDEIKNVFTQSTSEFKTFNFNTTKIPYVILIIGVNGVGKTTSIGKLAYNFKKAGKSVLIGSADTFRAAANQQLEIWAKRAEVDIVQNVNTGDPASVAFDTISSAIAKKKDVVLIDTAGRLHNKSHLMEELKKIKRVIKKLIQDAPHEIFIVIDANTGQNAINQVKEFKNAMDDITGIILTKIDGTAKGGIIVKISKELNIPIRFIGVGEQIDDLQLFDSETFVKALLEK